MRRYLLNSIVLVLTLTAFSSVSGQEKTDGKLSYFLSRSVSGTVDTTLYYLIPSEEGQWKDTLFQQLAKDGTPLAYYRNIVRSVCFDDKCRLMTLNLYWNITGRYLGIELPPGEFLSKTDHDPFKLADYQRLNALMDDSSSLLRTLTYEEIVPQKDSSRNGVDAVTAPTSKAVSEYVVQGAGYTTYTLYHLIYGATQQVIIQLTEERLNNELLLRLLRSPELSDIYWALDRIPQHTILNDELQEEILAFISDNNYYLATRAIRSISSRQLNDQDFQACLLEKFIIGSYSLKNLIVEKFSTTAAPSRAFVAGLRSRLGEFNGALLVNVLKLFADYKIYDKTTLTAVAGLLNNTNSFIANHAYRFVKSSDTNDAIVLKKIQQYEEDMR